MATIVDLSHPIEDGLVTYPGLPAPSIGDHLARADAPEHYEPGFDVQIGRIEMVANTGTYLDTPFHFAEDGHDLAGLDPALVTNVPGLVVPGRLTGPIGADALADLSDDDLGGRAVLVRTGWDAHWRTERYGSPDHPHLALETAQRLIAAGAALVGIDSVNIDGTDTGARPVHRALLSAGIPIVEHLRDLATVGDRPFTFTALPPAVRGMASFPVRAVAVVAG